MGHIIAVIRLLISQKISWQMNTKMKLRGSNNWSFSDQPWVAGFRGIAINGSDKPVLMRSGYLA
jgi:hypothetical protein